MPDATECISAGSGEFLFHDGTVRYPRLVYPVFGAIKGATCGQVPVASLPRGRVGIVLCNR